MSKQVRTRISHTYPASGCLNPHCSAPDCSVTAIVPRHRKILLKSSTTCSTQRENIGRQVCGGRCQVCVSKGACECSDGLKFTVQSPEEIQAASVLQVHATTLYQVTPADSTNLQVCSTNFWLLLFSGSLFACSPLASSPACRRAQKHQQQSTSIKTPASTAHPFIPPVSMLEAPGSTAHPSLLPVSCSNLQTQKHTQRQPQQCSLTSLLSPCSKHQRQQFSPASLLSPCSQAPGRCRRPTKGYDHKTPIHTSSEVLEHR